MCRSFLVAQWVKELAFHCSGLGHGCDAGSIPGPGTSTCQQEQRPLPSKKNKNKKKDFDLLSLLALVLIGSRIIS